MAGIKKHVRYTWAAVEGIGLEAAGVALFRNIFTIAPPALQLFSFMDDPDLYNSASLKVHALRVMTMVGSAVAGLDDLPTLAASLKELGKKHVARGVLPAHWEVVGQALIKTLEENLNEAFTAEVKAAWVAVYQVVQDSMISDNYD